MATPRCRACSARFESPYLGPRVSTVFLQLFATIASRRSASARVDGSADRRNQTAVRRQQRAWPRRTRPRA